MYQFTYCRDTSCICDTSNPDWTTTIQLGDQATPCSHTNIKVCSEQRQGRKCVLVAAQALLDLMECSPFYRSQSHMLDFIPPRLHNCCWCYNNSWDKSEVPSSVCFRVGIPVFCDIGPTLNNMCWSVSPLSTLNCWRAVPCTLSLTDFTAELIVCLWFYCVFLQHLCNL